MNEISFSAVILASRPRSLRLCLESLALAQPANRFECLLVLNGNDDACAETAAGFTTRIPGLRVLRGAPRSLGGARNAAVAEASGTWLCFLDDDVTLPPNYFGVLAEKIRRYPGACALGGPNLTAAGSSLFERCAGLILGSWLGAGPMRRRYGGYEQDAWTDDSGLILCNLCLRRETLISEHLSFDPELVRNEENLLLTQLLRRGHRALHAPALFVHHERRSTIAAFCRQCFLSGRGRGEMSVRQPSTLRVLYLTPLLLVLGCLGLLCRSGVFLAPAGLYIVLAALNAGWLAARAGEGILASAWLFILCPAAHGSYAAGLLTGFAAGLARRRGAAAAITAARETAADAR